MYTWPFGSDDNSFSVRVSIAVLIITIFNENGYEKTVPIKGMSLLPYVKIAPCALGCRLVYLYQRQLFVFSLIC